MKIPSKEKKLDDALNEIVEKSGTDKVTRKEAEKQLQDILSNVRSFSDANMKPKDMFLDDTLDGISKGILKDRKLDNLPAVRDFLGEYSAAKNVYGVIGRTKEKGGKIKYGKLRERDLDEQKVGLQYRVGETVSKMANLIEQTNYYKNLKRHSDSLPDDRKFLFNETPPNSFGQFEQIPDDISKYGALAGKYIKQEHIRAFTDIPQYINLASNASLSNRLYATFMGMKGASQIMKTVYSPITQIRNATTAAFFALRNGNFGNNEDLLNSAKVVFQNINDNLAFSKGAAEFKGSGAKLANKQQIKKNTTRTWLSEALLIPMRRLVNLKICLEMHQSLATPQYHFLARNHFNGYRMLKIVFLESCTKALMMFGKFIVTRWSLVG